MHIRMDWRSVKFDWNKARAFLVTAEEGSLSAAARTLGMAQPTLGSQVDGLEQEGSGKTLGIQIDLGLSFCLRCRRICYESSYQDCYGVWLGRAPFP